MKSQDKDDESKLHPGIPRIEETAGTYFVNFSLLNKKDYLKPSEREAVYEVIRAGHNERYFLFAFVVMPTHVHLVLKTVSHGKPIALSKAMHHIKGFSAHKVNQMRGTKGSLWLPRSHSRLLFSQYELDQKLNYIFHNPRVVRIVKKPEDYPFLWYWGKERKSPEPGL